MATNNAINNVIYPYRFCYQLSTDKLNVIGDSNYYQVPFDTTIEDSGGSFGATNYVTLSVSGMWVIGASIKLTDNYADITALSAAVFDKPAVEMLAVGMLELVPFGVTAPFDQTYKRAGYNALEGFTGYLPKGTMLTLRVAAEWGTGTNVFGLLGSDTSFPTMIWGYCYAPDYGILAHI
jgi:hypothetical protein